MKNQTSIFDLGTRRRPRALTLSTGRAGVVGVVGEGLRAFLDDILGLGRAARTMGGAGGAAAGTGAEGEASGVGPALWYPSCAWLESQEQLQRLE